MCAAINSNNYICFFCHVKHNNRLKVTNLFYMRLFLLSKSYMILMHFFFFIFIFKMRFLFLNLFFYILTASLKKIDSVTSVHAYNDISFVRIIILYKRITCIPFIFVFCFIYYKSMSIKSPVAIIYNRSRPTNFNSFKMKISTTHIYLV